MPAITEAESYPKAESCSKMAPRQTGATRAVFQRDVFFSRMFFSTGCRFFGRIQKQG
jgi:hypothetical protein